MFERAPQIETRIAELLAWPFQSIKKSAKAGFRRICEARRGPFYPVYRDAANRRWSSDKKKCPRHRQVMLKHTWASSRDDGSKLRMRRHLLWSGRVLLRRSPPSDR